MKHFGKIALVFLLIPVAVLAMPVSVCITNSSSKSLGAVIVHYSGGQTNLTISGEGNWVTTIPGDATAITINSQKTEYPTTKVILLPSGAKVKVKWKQQNLIEVIDLATQG